MRAGLPQARRAQKIGLLGGSFDPPHPGHVHLTRQALRAFGLDRVWWLVSPGNPLKPDPPAPLARRMSACREIMEHPRVVVTDIEARLGTRHTAETISTLRAIYPGTRFTWLMGADNMAGIHRWDDWRAIFAQVPVGVIARPGDPMAARSSKAARLFRAYRLPVRAAQLLGGSAPPVWCYLDGPRVATSSSAIRARGDWRRER